jgi:hypothetical protein
MQKPCFELVGVAAGLRGSDDARALAVPCLHTVPMSKRQRLALTEV